MSTATTNSKKFLIRFAFITILSAGLFYYIIFPIAAWNQNLPLMVFAALLPLAMNYMLALLAGIPMRGTDAQRFLKLVGLAVFGVLLWNHLWFLVAVLWIGLIIRNMKDKK